jgi:copper chaperone CopZ
MDTQPEPGTRRPSPASLDLAIEGMTCVACATRIEKVLERLPAVRASVNFATGHAHVAFDPGCTDAAALTDAVARAGYAARVIETLPGAEDATATAWRVLRSMKSGGIQSVSVMICWSAWANL